MKMTKQQLIAACAEIMGWRRAHSSWLLSSKPNDLWVIDYEDMKFIKVKDYNPLENDQQARELLEAWCDGIDGRRFTISGRSGFKMVELYEAAYCKQVAMSSRPHLPTAICLAVVSAEMGETVELID